MKKFTISKGFTLLEIMVVIAIIAILATLAIPSRTGPITQKKILETLDLVGRYKKPIEIYYAIGGEFPEHNDDLPGMPAADKILGNYLEKVEMREGVMHLFLGQKMPPELHGKIVSVRPVYVSDSPASGISWICGIAEVPEGMTGAGRNLTNVKALFLPGRCRI